MYTYIPLICYYIYRMRQYVDQRLVVDKRCGCIDKEFRTIIQKSTIICSSCKFELFVSECRVKYFS